MKRSSYDRALWLDLLDCAGLKEEKNLDATYGLFDGEDLVGTASRQANILKCLAIRHSYAGGAAFHQLISFLLTEIYQAGYEEVLVFTKASKRESFEHLGFKLLVETEDVAFMERSQAGLAAYLADLKAQAPFSEGQRLGAVVMNANPFTKGHRYLIEEALKAVDGLYVFVLSEDQSLFDKATRLNLVRQGTADLDQVYVVETKHYMVSQATFPAYFLKADQSAVKAQAAVDARLFKEKIAPSLGISQRFVGEEPLSPTTDSYNQVMAEIFAPELKLQIIPRRHLDQAGDVISASKVRALLLDGKLEAAQAYLPPASRAFVASQAGQTMLAERKDLSQSHDY
ncbi:MULTISPECIES: [citrate (pro-3S)-lyase] ligase [Aerococcus]|uniref:[citrate (pro-3S)-lyase] ligase n=1 Tax=Aerococcus TaxID=1375 RepID=UPI000ABFDE41|nr:MULTISPECIES: [citrate (pro-3S)-lyase] ligase [Aerococcus]MDK6368928.1 [citrate (pro-3S)-lyase] ligase [Aerococcus sp. UMB9870]MDK6680266.1 [citrate (pro-3S)-lyase] ligase [Aerococcus sp. UMB8608]MDK6687259.1 [citrate (pro-3S)-lyase] ligase [Aerococcus sp. UMB8623]MDK6940356.1 [citrate (pro-3S)-lyase] ligase [Aerococcus sp. UMB8487]